MEQPKTFEEILKKNWKDLESRFVLNSNHGYDYCQGAIDVINYLKSKLKP